MMLIPHPDWPGAQHPGKIRDEGEIKHIPLDFGNLRVWVYWNESDASDSFCHKTCLFFGKFFQLQAPTNASAPNSILRTV